MNYIGQKQDWNKGGIYKISNSIDDRIYIGSTKSLRDRYRHHKTQLKNGKNPSLLLQRFASKYGVDKLTFSVLEIVENEELLLLKEEEYIVQLKPALNAMLTALRPKGYKHTEATKNKMKTIANDAFSKGRQTWNKGKKLTEEEKEYALVYFKDKIVSFTTTRVMLEQLRSTRNEVK